MGREKLKIQCLLIGFLVQFIFSGTLHASEFCGNFDESRYFSSLKSLLDFPGKHEGATVDVIGLYVFAMPNSFLFENVSDYAANRMDLLNAKGAIRLEINRYRLLTSPEVSLRKAEFGTGAEGHIVRVKGIFYSRVFHAGSIMPFIDDIQDFKICADK